MGVLKVKVGTAYVPVEGGGVSGDAGGVLAGTYPNPTLADGAVDSLAISAAIKDAAAATASLRTLGTGATQAAAGNDARLSDARTPTAHNHHMDSINAGTISEDRLPTRLKPYHSNDVPGDDWNLAIETGVYAASGALNSPGAGWLIVHVEAHNSTWTVQTGHYFSVGDTTTQDSDTRLWRRVQDSGTWGPWYRLRWSEKEIAARHAVRVVYTGAAPARPANCTYVEWVGPNDPGANSINGDTWVPTA